MSPLQLTVEIIGHSISILTYVGMAVYVTLRRKILRRTVRRVVGAGRERGTSDRRPNEHAEQRRWRPARPVDHPTNLFTAAHWNVLDTEWP